MASGREADNAARVRWSHPASGVGSETLRDAAERFAHSRVELPSRRWYIEATGEADAGG